MTALRAAALLLACSSAPLAARAQLSGSRGPAPRSDVTPIPLEDVRIEEKLGGQVPLDVELVDWEGRPYRLSQAFDGKRPIVMALVYYDCPMLCGLVLSGMAKAMRGSGLTLGKDYQAVAISFDPREGPQLAAERRRGYLQSIGMPSSGADWPFLVGPGAGTSRIADSIGFGYRKDPSTGEWAHIAAIFALTPQGKVSRYFYGIEFPPQDLKLALMEASGGKVGTALDRVLLTCYRYDPAARRYVPYALGFLRLGGALVLFALAALILGLVVRERRRRRRVA